MRVFHTSYDPIPTLSDRPMWFSLSEPEALGWHEQSIRMGGRAITYEAEVIGMIMGVDSPVLRGRLADEGIDPDEYVGTLVCNPTADEVNDEPATRLLVAAGLGGVIHSDYDPRDERRTTQTLLVFRPNAFVSEWKIFRRD